MHPTTLAKHNTAEFLHASVFSSSTEFHYIETYYHDNTLSFPILMHKHSFYEINIIVRGSGYHYISNQCFEANAGSVYVIPPNFEHGYYTDNAEDYKIFHILLSSLFMERYKMELHSLPGFTTLFEIEPNLRADSFESLFLTLEDAELDGLISIFDEMSLINENKSAESDVKLLGHTLYLIPIFCRLILNSHSKIIENKHKYNNADAAAIIKTMEYMNKRFYEKIRIEDLTKIASMSRASYLRSFKQLTKQTPMEYLTHIRIEQATTMLLSDVSITRIAQDCGFYDSSHFTRCFIKLKKANPLAYKKANT